MVSMRFSTKNYTLTVFKAFQKIGPVIRMFDLCFLRTTSKTLFHKNRAPPCVGKSLHLPGTPKGGPSIVNESLSVMNAFSKISKCHSFSVILNS